MKNNKMARARQQHRHVSHPLFRRHGGKLVSDLLVPSLSASQGGKLVSDLLVSSLSTSQGGKLVSDLLVSASQGL